MLRSVEDDEAVEKWIRLAAYCEGLNEHLLDVQKSKEAFDECCAIVREALSNLNLEFERDSAKSAPLIEETERVARSRRPPPDDATAA